MAESSKSGSKKKISVIDPVYLKFTKGVMRAIGSMEFYEYFMDAISHADNEIQFSNRRMEKWIDRTWVNEIEATLEAFQKIVATPRNVIHEEELIVNVANAKKAGPDVVVHLAQHANLVEKFDADSGDVRPSRLMQKYREDSIGIYENRLVFTVLENAHRFVKIRHDALFSEMSDEFGAKLKIRSDMDSATEHVHMDMYLHIRDVDSALDTDGKHIGIFDRVSRLYRILTVYMNSPFAQQLAKLPRVKGKITKTNVLKKNPNYRAIVKLGEFLASYDDIGYTVNIIEQNPVVTEQFQQDIFHNVLFNYLVLKGYLEREQDRRMPVPTKEKKRALKPKFIKEIIEELTEDYDLPEVEIRKVLIEELTKEQLMKEEAAERRRLVEEQAARKKAEQERIRQEKAAEKERIRKEKEAEKERIRQEKAAEEERLKLERMQREIEENRRTKLLRKELEAFMEKLPKQLDAREAEKARKEKEKKDFEEAARLLEEAERRKIEAAEREKKRIQEEKDRIRREKQLAEEKLRLEAAERREAARLAKLAEEERLRREEEARLEAERLAKLAEEERIRREEEARLEAERQAQLAEEERLRREQDERDTAATKPYFDQVTIFMAALPQRLALRAQEEDRIRLEKEQMEAERQKRLAARAAAGK